MTKTNRLYCLTIATLSLLGTVSGGLADEPAGQERYRLRYHFIPTQTVHYRVTHSADIAVNVGGNPGEVQHQSDSVKHYRVTEVDPQGNAIAETGIDYASMSAAQGNQRARYDSRTDETPPQQFQGVHETIGRPLLRLKLSPTGQVLKAETLDGVHAAVDLEASGILNIFPVLPDEPVGVGETWRHNFEIDIVASQESPALKRRVKLQRQYTLESVEGDIATIAARTVTITPIRQPFQEGQLAQRMVKGTLQFDLKRGVVLSRQVSADALIPGAYGQQSSLTLKSSHEEKYLTPDEVKTALAVPASVQ
ncbi:hypothetical protein Mal4_32250 [Maioricimonas rarisocia]|uniref:Uncharacterized protein n=1 Tax=Maioricimonas rarisocia TaxID=2528026 RepID=A0A517Z8V0_9PLAN|nr:hypothetical protein [Maioricimonas rarisocia]QDU38893.1 hypothetical protein Mal4_32250 [Maioricimonas rarisocia]